MTKLITWGAATLFALVLIYAVAGDGKISTEEVIDMEEYEEVIEINSDDQPDVELIDRDTNENKIAETDASYNVTKVIDGDTIVISKDGVFETIRMIGIDTPETVHPSKSIQCFGLESSNKTKEWLTNSRVSLEFDEVAGERDKYNRLLAYVFRSDGLFVNLELIKQGYAYEYTYQGQEYQYKEDFKIAEDEARETEAGLWADGACGAVSEGGTY